MKGQSPIPVRRLTLCAVMAAVMCVIAPISLSLIHI